MPELDRGLRDHRDRAGGRPADLGGSNVDTTKLGRIIALLEGITCGDPASSRKA